MNRINNSLALSPKYLREIADRIRGQMIVAAPNSCTDAVEFMNGAREQAENMLYALTDAMGACGMNRADIDAFRAYATEGSYAVELAD